MRIKLTLEQLAIFEAVAERQHLTKAADALNLTPSAVSAAIRKLEENYGVALFDRPGRGIALTGEGRVFLEEARKTLASARKAERALYELGGLLRGTLAIAASQTIATYWLPPVLMRFHEAHPGIDLKLEIGNTADVATAVAEGRAEVGYIEGALADPRFTRQHLIEDALMIVVACSHPLAGRKTLAKDDLVKGTGWIMRERGSGTRSEFEHALAGQGVDPATLNIALELPSNEAVLSAVRSGLCAAALSGHVATPYLGKGDLTRLNFDLPARAFTLITDGERKPGRAAKALAAFSGPAG